MNKCGCPVARDNQKILLGIQSGNLDRPVGQLYFSNLKIEQYYITTRPPAITDVFESGHNVGALRPGRRVGFR